MGIFSLEIKFWIKTCILKLIHTSESGSQIVYNKEGSNSAFGSFLNFQGT